MLKILGYSSLKFTKWGFQGIYVPTNSKLKPMKNQPIKIFHILLFGTFLFLGADCKYEPTKPLESLPDTTSQNFTILRIDTLGFLFSSAHGVDIVDENNIWVAGMFTEQDTNGETLYNKNLAHWNGKTWNFVAVPMYGYNNTGPSPEELGAVKVFNDSSIFVVTWYDNSTAWWDGNKWTSSYVNDAVVSPHFWARSFGDMYFAASEGRATYSNGVRFTAINTGLTNPSLSDVWGDEDEVYAVGYGSSPSEGTETVFLSGNENIWKIVNKTDVVKDNNSTLNSSYQYVGPMYSVFRASRNSKLWFLAGEFTWIQLYEVENLSPFRAKLFKDFPNDFGAQSIRGNADNDLYAVSQRNAVFYHFNGSTWYKYEPPVYNFLLAYSTSAFTVRRDVWAAVGFSTANIVDKAIVMIGKHN
jgi:hypothetical protein